MSAAIFVIIYGVYCAFSAFLILHINYRNLNFVDGIFFGTIYFIAVPLLLIFISGDYKMSDISMLSYDPIRDAYTTYSILAGLWTVAVYHFFSNIVRTDTTNHTSIFIHIFNARRLKLIILITGSFAVWSFILSGKANSEGGHWAELAENNLSSSFMTIFVTSLNNALRAMLFGALIWASEQAVVPRRRAVTIGILFSLFDIAMTFNRITLAYCALAIVIIYRDRLALLAMLAIPLLPVVAFLSTMWTSVRGAALHNGYSWDSFARAFDDALYSPMASSHSQDTIAAQSNGVFETSNIQVLHHIMTTVGNSVDPLWGWTLVLRPIAVFIPSTIWSGKPGTYGVTIGESMGVPGLSLNSTLFGEPYGNFYGLWIVALLAVIFVYQLLFRIFGRNRPYVGPMSAMAGFAACRFEVTFLSTCLIALVVIIAAGKFLDIALARIAGGHSAGRNIHLD